VDQTLRSSLREDRVNEDHDITDKGVMMLARQNNFWQRKINATSEIRDSNQHSLWLQIYGDILELLSCDNFQCQQNADKGTMS